jgi:hypothetical protein
MNRVLQERIGYLLKRPVDRPSNDVRRYHASFTIRPKAGRERAVSSPRSSGSGRALSARRLHRHQHGEARRECGRLLQ